MKQAFLIIVISVLGLRSPAQQPVSWTYSATKLGERLYEIHLTASIIEGWHIYSQRQPKDAIAFPTTIQFNKSPLFNCIGGIQEAGRLEKARIEVLDIVQHQYAHKVDFVQRIQLKSNVKLQASGVLKFQACTDEECLPAAELPFSIPID